MNWKVFLASATGRHHLAGNEPCQDFGHFAVIDDVLIGVVCDGAGSAREGHVGAEFFARTLIGLLSDAVASGGIAQLVNTDDQEALLASVRDARTQLEELARSQELEARDFACTLVGCVASHGGGRFFHVGDGVAIQLEDSGESVVSRPENGEYSDETYFVTDENWEEHLRVTRLAAVGRGCRIGLMSDGASPFVVDRAKTGFFRPFIDPVVAFLRDASEPVGNQALQSLLEDERTLAITSDDKTLLLALAS